MVEAAALCRCRMGTLARRYAYALGEYNADLHPAAAQSHDKLTRLLQDTDVLYRTVTGNPSASCKEVSALSICYVCGWGG
jgi:hypothetical protein